MAQNAVVQKWFNFYLYLCTLVSLARIQLCQAQQSHAVFTYPALASLPNPYQITFCLHFSNQMRECDNSGSRGKLSDCLFVQSKTQFRGPHSDATDSAPDWERVKLQNCGHSPIGFQLETKMDFNKLTNEFRSRAKVKFNVPTGVSSIKCFRQKWV